MFEQLRRDDCALNLRTYRASMSVLAECGRGKEAMMYLQEMKVCVCCCAAVCCVCCVLCALGLRVRVCGLFVVVRCFDDGDSRVLLEYLVVYKYTRAGPSSSMYCQFYCAG